MAGKSIFLAEGAEQPTPAGSGTGTSGPAASNPTPPAPRIVTYANGRATRNQPLTTNLEGRIGEAVTAVYGSGYTARVYSGGQPGKGESSKRVGSVRHDHGRAADIHIYGPDGKQVTGDALAPLGKFWREKGYGGVGMEMHGGGVHLDEWTTPPPGGGMAWGYDKQGGSYTPAMRAALATDDSSAGTASASTPAGTPAAIGPSGTSSATSAAGSGTAPVSAPARDTAAPNTPASKWAALGDILKGLGGGEREAAPAVIKPVQTEVTPIEATSVGGPQFIDNNRWNALGGVLSALEK